MKSHFGTFNFYSERTIEFEVSCMIINIDRLFPNVGPGLEKGNGYRNQNGAIDGNDNEGS